MYGGYFVLLGTFSMLLESSALLMWKELVNTLPKVMGFLRALRFPPTWKLRRINTDRKVKISIVVKIASLG